MQIRLVSTGKKRFLPLLLLADEQESMIDRYLERGDLYVMYDKLLTEPVAVAVVTDEGKGIRELKNLAVAPHWQRKGYGRQMEEVANISDYFADKVQSASYAKEAKQGKKLREAVYGNFKLMKRTLTNEQYKKYVQLLNVTLKNKGLDSYMEDVANK